MVQNDDPNFGKKKRANAEGFLNIPFECPKRGKFIGKWVCQKKMSCALCIRQHEKLAESLGLGDGWRW